MGIYTSIPSTDNIELRASGSQIGSVQKFGLTGQTPPSYITYPLGTAGATHQEYVNMSGGANLKLTRELTSFSMVSNGDGNNATDKPGMCMQLAISADNEKCDGLIFEVNPPNRGVAQGNTVSCGDQKFRLKLWYYIPGMSTASDQTTYGSKKVDLRICGRVLKDMGGHSSPQNNEAIWLHADNTSNAQLSDNSSSRNGGWCDQQHANLGMDTTRGWASWFPASTLDDPNAVFEMNAPSNKGWAYVHARWSQDIQLKEIVNSADVNSLNWDDTFQIAIARNTIAAATQPLNQNSSAPGSVDNYGLPFFIVGVDIEWLT